MYKNYFLVAWRNLVRRKGLSFISVFGLAVGIACFCLCAMYVRYERSFDRFHGTADRIYRVLRIDHSPMQAFAGEVSGMQCGPLGPAMKKELPEVVDLARYSQPAASFVKVGSVNMRELVSYADPEFFSMFSFPLKEGAATTALKNPGSAVVTESAARRLFGNTEAMGQRVDVELDGKFVAYTVSGVAADAPANSSITFNILCNIEGIAASPMADDALSAWRFMGPFETFVRLKAGGTIGQQQLDGLQSRFLPWGQPLAKGATVPVRFQLEPLREIHTDTRLRFNSLSTVEAGTLWMLMALATGVLLIACINFTTLSIGRSAGRALEVGVRKVIGGSRRMLLSQFLIESLLLTMIAASMGIGLARLLLPLFERLAGVSLPVDSGLGLWLAGLLLLLVPAVGLLAGCYPALVLARFRPVEVLKTNIRIGGSNFFTKSLVALQFTLSAGLVICAVVVLQQSRYLQERNPGFDKENVVMLDGEDVPDIDRRFSVFRQLLATSPEVVGVGAADNRMGKNGGFSSETIKNNDSSITLYSYHVDDQFIPVMGMRLLEGRRFDRSVAADSAKFGNIIINEALSRVLGRKPGAVVGTRLELSPELKPTIIGVVKDFDFFSDLHRQVGPMYFFHYRLNFDHYSHFYVRIRPGEPARALAAIAAAWKQVAPEYVLKYNFVDDDLDHWYEAAQRVGRIVVTAGVLSIVLACLGLFGLAALAATNRTKEMGIRRILGASVGAVVGLLSKDFLRLVGLAFILAAPVSWWVMRWWLQDYVYRIQVQWWVFAVTGLGMIAVALLTVGWQGVRAAVRNPVDALRSE